MCLTVLTSAYVHGEISDGQTITVTVQTDKKTDHTQEKCIFVTKIIKSKVNSY